MSAILPCISWKCRWAAELLALVDVGHDDVERRLHEAERAGGKHGALVVEAGHQDLDALPRLAEHVVLGHFAVLEDEFAGFRAAHAELVELLGDGEAGKVCSRR
jgi:hypothetical protein